VVSDGLAVAQELSRKSIEVVVAEPQKADGWGARLVPLHKIFYTLRRDEEVLMGNSCRFSGRVTNTANQHRRHFLAPIDKSINKPVGG
jgi:hypothetical protein